MSDEVKPDDMPQTLWDMRLVYAGGVGVRADRCSHAIKKFKEQFKETPAKFLAELNSLEKKYLELQALKARQGGKPPEEEGDHDAGTARALAACSAWLRECAA